MQNSRGLKFKVGGRGVCKILQQKLKHIVQSSESNGVPTWNLVCQSLFTTYPHFQRARFQRTKCYCLEVCIIKSTAFEMSIFHSNGWISRHVQGFVQQNCISCGIRWPFQILLLFMRYNGPAAAVAGTVAGLVMFVLRSIVLLPGTTQQPKRAMKRDLEAAPSKMFFLVCSVLDFSLSW